MSGRSSRITLAASRPSVVLVGGIRMSATTRSGFTSRTTSSKLGPVTGLTDDVQTRALQQARQAYAKQHVVVGDHHPPSRRWQVAVHIAARACVFVQRPVSRRRYLQLAGMPGLALAGGLDGRQR